MIIVKYIRKLISVALLTVVFFVILFNFNILFPALNRNALAAVVKKPPNPIDIPSNINFLNDDKKAFCEYLKQLYGINLPLTVDNETFIYFGSVNGYRLYRMNATLIPCEKAHQSSLIGSYLFESDVLFHPYNLGLYVVGDDGVYTLGEAYGQNLVSISEAYNLYISKMKLQPT